MHDQMIEIYLRVDTISLIKNRHLALSSLSFNACEVDAEFPLRGAVNRLTYFKLKK